MDEARIEDTEQGPLPAGEGWFVLNLGEMPWETGPGFGVWRDFNWDQKPAEPNIGVHIHVLQPGESLGYYHAEARKRGSSCSAASVWPSCKGKSDRCGSGTTCIHRPTPLTSWSAVAMDRARFDVRQP